MWLPRFIRNICTRIRHWRYVRFLMYGNRASRKEDREIEEKERKIKHMQIQVDKKCKKNYIE